jgi:hypothetical protein
MVAWRQIAARCDGSVSTVVARGGGHAETSAIAVVSVAMMSPGAAHAPAQESIRVDGTATGRVVPLGSGSFRLVGTFVDSATGQRGSFVGSFVETTTGYISSRGQTGHPLSTPDPRCNHLSGEITIRLTDGVRFVAVISDLSPIPFERTHSAICLSLTNPAERELYVEFYDPRPDRGPALGSGRMEGTLVPQGAAYAATFDPFMFRFLP